MQPTPRIILFLDSSRGFGRGLLSGIARYSALNGPWTFYRKSPVYLKSDTDINLEELHAWKPDGIICSIAQSKKIAAMKLPMIAYDPGTYSGPIPCIVSDHANAARLAAEHLMDQGHGHFAYCGFNHLAWSEERGRTFCETVRKTHAEVHLFAPPSDTISWTEEEPAIKEWLQTLPNPVGLLCANDDWAESVMELCRLLDYSIPEDISVIGVDDDETICELQNPPLSSVRKALRFIRENINQSIRVSDVVRATSLSHRALNEQFHIELNGSIKTQLTRARIDYICRLLTETDLRVQEIALAAGYEDDCHFSRYFKRTTGLTPPASPRRPTGAASLCRNEISQCIGRERATEQKYKSKQLCPRRDELRSPHKMTKC